MDEFNDHVMIALLPITSDWCDIELPHLTLVYAGTIDELKASAHNELAKEVSAISMLSSSITLKVVEPARFDDGKVDVLRLRLTPELDAMRHTVKGWNKSEHPFNPHVTCGPANGRIRPVPSYIAFNRIMLAWGTSHLVFWLNGAKTYR